LTICRLTTSGREAFETYVRKMRVGSSAVA
jgi:hypothetical protein